MSDGPALGRGGWTRVQTNWRRSTAPCTGGNVRNWDGWLRRGGGRAVLVELAHAELE
jgi:hypothetical protein